MPGKLADRRISVQTHIEFIYRLISLIHNCRKPVPLRALEPSFRIFTLPNGNASDHIQRLGFLLVREFTEMRSQQLIQFVHMGIGKQIN